MGINIIKSTICYVQVKRFNVGSLKKKVYSVEGTLFEVSEARRINFFRILLPRPWIN